jgi:hypothetical protein
MRLLRSIPSLSMTTRWVAGALAVILGIACGADGSSTAPTSGSTQSGGGGGTGSTDFGVGGGGGLDACVAATQAAELTPLDVYLMLDQSGSMVGTYDSAQYDTCTAAFDAGKITSRARWKDVTTALDAFMIDPKSAGINIGLGFFPPKQAVQNGPKCEGDKCDLTAYSTPSVPIAPLPANASPIAEALSFTPCPCNGTPMSAALQGAVAYAKQQTSKQPERKVAVVLATDGVPNGDCSGSSGDPQSYTAPKDVAHDAYQGSPSIPVYVIGVGSQLTSLNALAKAGGTSAAFLVDGNQGTEAALIAALNQIRGQALSCEVPIPAAPAGQTLEPGKVNVIFSPGDGSADVTFTNVADKSGCSASPKSWYYDDPEAPTKVILCEAACGAVQGDGAAKIDVGFGCATVLADPK